MHSLEKPFHLARVCVQSDQRIAVQIVALAIEAIIIAGWASERGVEQAALGIHRHVEAPVVNASAILPSVLRPGVVTGLARPRDRVKIPNRRARTRIVSARVARFPGSRLFGNICADEDEVLENGRWRVVGHHQVDFALFTEARVDLAGLGVEREHSFTGSKDDARRIGAIARPIGDAASRWTARRQLIAPDFLARFGLERDHTLAAGQIHDAAHYDGRHLREGEADQRLSHLFFGSEAILPSELEIRDVRRSYLREWRIARARWIVRVHGPVAVLREKRRQHAANR